MLMLLLITTLACLFLCWAKPEGNRPFAVVAVGVLSLLLAARATALLASPYADALVTSACAEDETAEAEDPAASEASEAEVTRDEDMLDSLQVEVYDAAADESATETPIEEFSEGDSVQQVTAVKYLSPRPDWVESRPKFDGAMHQLAVESGLYFRKREADRALRDELQKALNDYVDDHVGTGLASELIRPGVISERRGDQPLYKLSVNDRTFDITQEVFDEQVEVSFGVMHQSHALVKLDQAVRDQVDHRWSEIKATSRLLQTSLSAGALILLLGTLFGYLKLDTATRGYYTGRLQFGAGAVILALIAASVFLGKWFPWM